MDLNATAEGWPAVSLHELFLERATQQPGVTAIVTRELSLSYAQLEQVSRHVAARLLSKELEPSRPVAIVMQKGWEQVAGALGVLRAGAAYLPLDAGLPAARLGDILVESGARIALTQPWLSQRLHWPESVEPVVVAPQAVAETSPVTRTVDPGDLAYIIYTSGSTGRPKGVMIDHRGAVNTISDINRRFGVGPGDRVFAVSSLSFDLSVYDVFGTLAAGGTVVIPEESEGHDPAAWLGWVRQGGITIWNSVPALMSLLVESAQGAPDGLGGTLRLVLLSGDWIPVSLPDRIRALAPAARVISLGGATEASIWSIAYPVEKVDPSWTSIPYGRPLANQTFHVLDEALLPRPTWVPGQLYIGGTGVAQGYWRDPERSASSFITHPYTGERLYRTGDLGRYLPDGNIEFLGREDLQVKLSGFRVELGEIEAALLEWPAVQAAAVVAVGPARGDTRLVAHVVPRAGDLLESDIRRYLQQRLPGYMVPGRILLRSQLPLSANGKLDRRTLAEEALRLPEALALVPATDHLVERFATIAAEVLGIPQLDPRRNLFEIGASSIDVIRMAQRIEQEFGRRPRLDELYRASTVAELAAAYAAGHGATDSPQDVELILEAGARHAFKEEQRDLRARTSGDAVLPLDAPERERTLEERYCLRRSFREFDPGRVPAASLGRLLASLRRLSFEHGVKYLYPSAGALYPVQTYVHLRPGHVEGLQGGTYYYDPAEHALVSLKAGIELPDTIHDPHVNRPIFHRSSFSLFLVAAMNAIKPMYGHWSRDFCLIEAGAMSQLLMTVGPDEGLGLCPVGQIDATTVAPLLQLEEQHEILLILLGGPIDRSTARNWRPARAAQESAEMPDTEEALL